MAELSIDIESIDIALRNGDVSGWTVGHSEWPGTEVPDLIENIPAVLFRGICCAVVIIILKAGSNFHRLGLS